MAHGILTPSATRQLLRDLQLQPKKRLGQNFLIDGNIVRKSISMAGIQPGDHVVEIGPGLGTLTAALLDAGAKVHAVETDDQLYNHLNSSLTPHYPDRLELLHADAVKFPLAGLPAASTSFKIVANLPYAISTPWLEKVLSGPLPSQMVLMLQKEAAGRYTASCGSKAYGAITVFLQASYERSSEHNVSRRCFYPAPAVDSVLLNLTLKPSPVVFKGKAKSVIRSIFSQRRKQIGTITRHMPEMADWLARLDSLGIPLSTRPESIPLSAWLELDSLLTEPH